MELFSESTDEYSSNIFCPPLPSNERVFFTQYPPPRCSREISISNPETQDATV